MFGTVIGSLSNVIIYRTPYYRSIWTPPSHCTSCGKELPGYLNIPIISYLVLRGHCRFCGSRFTSRYLWVELTCGLLFALVVLWTYTLPRPQGYALPLMTVLTYRFTEEGPTLWAPNWIGVLLMFKGIVFAWLLLVLSMIDLEHRLLPDRFTYPGIVLGLLLSVVAPLNRPEIAALGTHGVIDAVLQAVIGMIVGGGLLYLIAIIVPAGMGGGDVKLLAMIGAFVGICRFYRGFLSDLWCGGLVGAVIMIVGLIGTRWGQGGEKVQTVQDIHTVRTVSGVWGTYRILVGASDMGVVYGVDCGIEISKWYPKREKTGLRSCGGACNGVYIWRAPFRFPISTNSYPRHRANSQGIEHKSWSLAHRAGGKTNSGMIGYNVKEVPIDSHPGHNSSPSVKKENNQFCGEKRDFQPVGEKEMTQRRGISPGLIVSNGQKGFTLVELLVVVGVFVVLVMMTVPNYLATRPFRLLSGETNRLAAVIRQGRLTALKTNDKVYLEFLPELDMYRLWTHQGWRAYADIIDPSIPRNPDAGHYNGDLDGDGDAYWGTGPIGAPTGPPEDPDVVKDAKGNWVYHDTDGTYADPDVLLMTTYPGNQPIRTVSPKLRMTTDPVTGNLTNISRDLSDSGFVAGDNIVPLDVDMRMEEDAWTPNQPLGIRNGVLSHFPLIFIVFFPDGTLAASWDQNPPSLLPKPDMNEIIDLKPGSLGAAQIHLQVRGDKYHEKEYNLYDPTICAIGGEGPGEPQSRFETLSIDQSNSDSYGRIITVNNLSGRVLIRNYKPSDLDVDAPAGAPWWL